MANAVGGAARSNGQANGLNGHTQTPQVLDHFIGGNELSKAPPSKVKDFVAASAGHTVITSVRSATLQLFTTY